LEKLSLVRVIPQNSRQFIQYIPGNMHKLVENPDNICVGAVYERYSCAAALAEKANGQFYLVSIFVDPQARRCGLGTYLLRGITGEVKKTEVNSLKFIYSPSMLEGGMLSGIFKRAGFRINDPIATSFSVRFGELKAPGFSQRGFPGVEIMRLSALPDRLMKKYIADADDGLIPPHADIRTAQGEVLNFCTLACVVGGKLAGVIINTRTQGEILVRSLYVYEAFRRKAITGLLIGSAIREATKVISKDDVVRITPISTVSYALCEKFLERKYFLKETEFLAGYIF
jgi:GNAT superfamily N-acetyltransferase